MSTRWTKESLAPRRPGERGTHVWLFAVGDTERPIDTVYAAVPTLEHLTQFWRQVADGTSTYSATGRVLTIRCLLLARDCGRRELIKHIAAAQSEDGIARDDLHIVYWLGHADKDGDDDHILYLPRLEFETADSSPEVVWSRELAAHIGSLSQAAEQCFFFDVCSTAIARDKRPAFVPLPRPRSGGSHDKWQAIMVGSGHGREGMSSPEGDRRPALFAAALTRVLESFGAAPNGFIRDIELLALVVSSLIAEEWLVRGYRGFPDLTGVCGRETYFAHTVAPPRPFRNNTIPVRLGSSRQPSIHVLIGVKAPDINAVLLKCRSQINTRRDAVNRHVVWHGSLSPSAPRRATVQGRTIHEVVRCNQRNKEPVAVHEWFADGDR